LKEKYKTVEKQEIQDQVDITNGPKILLQKTKHCPERQYIKRERPAWQNISEYS